MHDPENGFGGAYVWPGLQSAIWAGSDPVEGFQMLTSADRKTQSQLIENSIYLTNRILFQEDFSFFSLTPSSSPCFFSFL